MQYYSLTGNNSFMKRKHTILRCHPDSRFIEEHTFTRDYICPLCGKEIELKISHERPKTPDAEKISRIGFSCDNCGCLIGLYAVDSNMLLKDMIKIAEKDYHRWEFNRLRKKDAKRKSKKLKKKSIVEPTGKVE